MEELLKPENLRSVAGLQLAARRTLRTLLPGINASIRTGSGQTFSQYRSYQPGDDLRRLDWKLYARSDRFYIREAEIETHHTLRFVLDASASMLHEDAGGLRKIDYARYLIATLAWLGLQQGDRLAFYAMQGAHWAELAPRSGQIHYRRMLHELLQLDPQGVFTGGKKLDQLLGRHRGPDLIVFISDLYEKDNEITETLRQLSKTRHELLVFHVLGNREWAFDYKGVLEFEDLETGERVQVNAGTSGDSLRKSFLAHLEDLRQKMLGWGVSYDRVRMDTLPGEAIRQFLLRRRKLA